MSAPNLTGGRCPMHPLQGVPCTICGTQVLGTGSPPLLLLKPAVPVSALRALLKTHAQYQGYGALRDDLTALCDHAEGKP